MHIALGLLLLLALASGMGWFGYAILGSLGDRATAGMEHQLGQAGLTVDPPVWRLLVRIQSRRVRWARIGGSAGLGLGWMTGVLVDRQLLGAAALLGVGGMLVGISMGSALSAQVALTIPSDQPRWASLEVHGLRDYLRRREVGLQIVLAGAGLLGIVAGGLSLAFPALGMRSSLAWLLCVLGGLLGGTGTAALVLQRRLLRAPMRVRDDSDLIAGDIQRALGLRDLVGAVLASALFSVQMVLTWLGLPLWQVCAGVLVFGLVASRCFDVRLRAEFTPVARVLAGHHPEPRAT